MKRKFAFYLLGLVLFFAKNAHALQISVGGGWAYTLDSFDHVSTSVPPDKKGGPSFNLQITTSVGIPALRLGLEAGYLRYSHYEFPTGAFAGFGREEYDVPILVVARFNAIADLYAQAMAGMTLNAVYTNPNANGDFGTHLTPYLALGAAVGYAWEVVPGFSIDPRVSLYLFNVSGLYTQVSPTLNFALGF